VRYLGRATEGLEKIQDEINADMEGVVIPIQVQWQANPHRIRER
jgi:hypothetical protein